MMDDMSKPPPDRAASVYCNQLGMGARDNNYLVELATKAFLAGVEWRDVNPAWISCKDKLPKFNTINLVYKLPAEISIAYLDEDGFNFPDQSPSFDDVTHWMSLPQPPAKEEK